jgi:CBS domain-containing protein
MTEKIARRGVLVPTEYAADILDKLTVRDVMTQLVVTLRVNQTVGEVRDWLGSGTSGTEHRGFPILDETGNLVGLVMRRALLNSAADVGLRLGDMLVSQPVIVFDRHSLRDVANLMAAEDIGRFPVVLQDQPRRLVGIISRSDILAAHRRQREDDQLAPSLVP